ncbi:hypothetical protein Tcan_13465 [Toxocara canis]|uniref:Uncharacterized protein n=1 Tax=Toxocara canis TaxID=6265 RepID=A0A0B2VQH9_TOXCA|nr:hypothetical protein Tcan_13465 [Toxocara canis]
MRTTSLDTRPLLLRFRLQVMSDDGRLEADEVNLVSIHSNSEVTSLSDGEPSFLNNVWEGGPNSDSRNAPFSQSPNLMASAIEHRRRNTQTAALSFRSFEVLNNNFEVFRSFERQLFASAINWSCDPCACIRTDASLQAIGEIRRQFGCELMFNTSN